MLHLNSKFWDKNEEIYHINYIFFIILIYMRQISSIKFYPCCFCLFVCFETKILLLSEYVFINEISIKGPIHKIILDNDFIPYLLIQRLII